ncbi:MAG: RluA family pseudouridine synthase [Bacteroidota bacterium]
MSEPAVNCLNRFSTSVADLGRPERFTFPFFYQPHPLAIKAAEELQAQLSAPLSWSFDFGDDTTNDAQKQGKMFGVLVVEDHKGELAYLAAFSGKLADSNHLPGFVPPVYDLLPESGYYKTEERQLNELNAQIELLEQSPDLRRLRQQMDSREVAIAAHLESERLRVIAARAARKKRRQLALPVLTKAAYADLEQALSRESISMHFELKDLRRKYREELEELRAELAVYTDQIDALRRERKQRSNALQSWIFRQYEFLNARGETRDLVDIFKETVVGVPASGAGECAAPKLLNYAYQQGLKPVTMAEFWWGQSPSSEIRKHRHFYPACRGKCEPILGHMLQGLTVDPNPMMSHPAYEQDLEIVYEDEALAIVNKPAGFLSVPGKTVTDSVMARMKKRYPDTDSPLIVHRLDMSTSGLLLIPKTKKAHRHLQQQFEQRSIKKRYLALLDGILEREAGTIVLPLKGDFYDRPRQMVDHEKGKFCKTEFRVIERMQGRTLIHFWPVTGRTHQLRVHAAHPEGLNIPILGDEFYGKMGDRLCLHAEWIELTHPNTGERVSYSVEVDFGSPPPTEEGTAK